MINGVEQWVGAINDFLWTYIMIAMLIGTALWFSFRTRFVQFQRLGEMVRLLGEGVKEKSAHTEVSSFQAFCISLASRVGTGNMAGVATAIFLGGPGAIFWMWVIALLGSVSAFIESTLAQMFKQKGKDSFIGGPAYYIQHGLGKRWMAILFAISITVTFGLIFNSVQSNTVAISFEHTFGFDRLYVGIGLTILSLIIIFGGVHRIAVVSGVVVPLMAIFYVLLSVVLIIINITELPGILLTIFKNAFGWEQAVSGGVGAALMQGIKRGLFSNEAGLGSAPNAAATATVTHPVKQGYIQALGVFTDTLLICSSTAFIILMADPAATAGKDGIALTQAALNDEIGMYGSVFVSVAIFFFTFTTILGNYYYGEANILFFTKRKSVLMAYRFFVALMVFLGSMLSLQLVWSLADISMAVMGLINLIAILLLGKYAIIALQDYRAQRKAGNLDPVFRASTIPEISHKLVCWQDEESQYNE